MDQREHSHGSCLANTSEGFFSLFLGFPPSAVKVPKIINIRNKHSFASIAFFTIIRKQIDNILSM